MFCTLDTPIAIINESPRSAEPSLQMLFKKQEWYLTIFDCSNNYSYWDYNYMCVCAVTTYTTSPLCWQLEKGMYEMKWVDVEIDSIVSLEPAQSCSRHYINCTSLQAVIQQQ